MADSICNTHDYTVSYIFEVKKISNELMDEGRILGSEIKKHLKWEQYIYYLFIYQLLW